MARFDSQKLLNIFSCAFPHACAIKLQWNLVCRSHFSTFHLILKATWLTCYCILSSLLPPFWFSAKLTKGYIYKSVNILNSFIPYHQISSYLPTFTKFTKFLLYHWKLKKKRGNIEKKKPTSGNKVKQSHNANLSHWIKKPNIFSYLSTVILVFFPPLLLMFLITIALLNHNKFFWLLHPQFYG